MKKNRRGKGKCVLFILHDQTVSARKISKFHNTLPTMCKIFQNTFDCITDTAKDRDVLNTQMIPPPKKCKETGKNTYCIF